MDSSAAIYIDLPDTHLRTMAKIIHNKKNTPAQWRNMPPSSSLQAMLAKNCWKLVVFFQDQQFPVSRGH